MVNPSRQAFSPPDSTSPTASPSFLRETTLQWVYVGNTDSVVRFAYQNGDLKASGPAQHIVDLPHGGGHWTRDVQFTTDGKKMFVAVGSAVEC